MGGYAHFFKERTGFLDGGVSQLILGAGSSQHALGELGEFLLFLFFAVGINSRQHHGQRAAVVYAVQRGDFMANVVAGPVLRHAGA